MRHRVRRDRWHARDGWICRAGADCGAPDSRPAASPPTVTSRRPRADPRAHRAVGNIMRDVRRADVPCHRVIAAAGRLGGYGGNLELKRGAAARRRRPGASAAGSANSRAPLGAGRAAAAAPRTRRNASRRRASRWIAGNATPMATSKMTALHPSPERRARRPAGTPRRALVERCRSGELGAFEELYRRTRAGCSAWRCRMLGNPADAEDLLQDIFLSAHRKLETFRGESALGTWLYRLATNHLPRSPAQPRGAHRRS